MASTKAVKSPAIYPLTLEDDGNIEVGLSCVFHGLHSKPASLLSLFHIFALSSDTEQMPYTVIEAMASGLPVAATGRRRYSTHGGCRQPIVCDAAQQ
jgi:glycosyltransferase involved in cell wall biosynthesis